MLTQDLNLNPEQQTRMRSILEEQHQQAMTIVEDSALSREEKVQKIRTLRTAGARQYPATSHCSTRKANTAARQQSAEFLARPGGIPQITWDAFAVLSREQTGRGVRRGTIFPDAFEPQSALCGVHGSLCRRPEAGMVPQSASSGICEAGAYLRPRSLVSGVPHPPRRVCHL